MHKLHRGFILDNKLLGVLSGITLLAGSLISGCSTQPDFSKMAIKTDPVELQIARLGESIEKRQMSIARMRSAKLRGAETTSNYKEGSAPSLERRIQFGTERWTGPAIPLLEEIARIGDIEFTADSASSLGISGEDLIVSVSVDNRRIIDTIDSISTALDGRANLFLDVSDPDHYKLKLIRIPVSG